jgi:hypothetical protein
MPRPDPGPGRTTAVAAVPLRLPARHPAPPANHSGVEPPHSTDLSPPTAAALYQGEIPVLESLRGHVVNPTVYERERKSR